MAALALLAGGPVAAQAGPGEAIGPAAVPTLARLYAEHVSGGRSDVEIHLSPAGPFAGARTQLLSDGSHRCDVSGLHLAAEVTAAEHADDLLAFMLVHEVTHCLVSPQAEAPGRTAGDAAGDAAHLLFQLTMESVADAHAVIALFRAGGAERAHRVVAFTLPQRHKPASIVHSTALAVRRALEQVIELPASVSSPQQAFAAALQIGRAAALQTFVSLLDRQGSPMLRQAPQVLQVDAELDRALPKALAAFESGRFDNRAATLHAESGAASPADRHFFVNDDGSVRLQAVVSAEGAHRAGELAAQMAEQRVPEQPLAIAWLRRQGALDSLSLPQTTLAIARMIRNVDPGSEVQAGQMRALLAQAIADSPPGADLWQLLESAIDALKVTQALR